jgi:hypothetical protein
MKVIRRTSIFSFLALTLLTASPLVMAQPSTSLTITGQTGSAKVIQTDGKNYVDVEGLARITNASISFRESEIVMTMGTQPDTPPAPAGFSKEFVTAGIELMAEQREWRAALKYAIEGGYPLSEAWLNSFRTKTQQALQLATVSANSSADKDALALLNLQFDNVSKLSEKYLQMASSLTYIDPRSLDSDPLDQKITTCGHSLASMATTNHFVDDGTCR